MFRVVALVLGGLGLAGAAQAQQTRSYCDGTVEVTGSTRGGPSGFQYTAGISETSHMAGTRRVVRITFVPPPPAIAQVVEPVTLGAGQNATVVIGSEPRGNGPRPSLERERMLNFVQVACGR